MKLTVGASRAQKVISQPSGLASCAGRGAAWSRAEAAHRRATTRQAAGRASAQALWMCAQCPLLDTGECHEIASAEGYSGLAAGTVYLDGVPRRPDHVVGRRYDDLADAVLDRVAAT